MLALIPVRDGQLPSGADEAIAECGGEALLIGSGLDGVELDGIATRAWRLAAARFEIGRWAELATAAIGRLGDDVDADIVVLPGSPDGRDLAPRLALALDRPLFAGATLISDHRVSLAVQGGRALHDHHPTGPFIATLQPGIRGVTPFADETRIVDLVFTVPSSGAPDAETVDVTPPDVRTMDLTEAQRIVGGGAGLDDATRFDQLDEFAHAISASMGATRVVTDRAWVHHDKQIGTTGVVVDPRLYLAFGISGAVQHTAGLGDPDHIISVNTDPHCPMMSMADLAIVSDANATLDALLALLGPPAVAIEGHHHG